MSETSPNVEELLALRKELKKAAGVVDRVHDAMDCLWYKLTPEEKAAYNEAVREEIRKGK